MASAQARRAHLTDARRVKVIGVDGNARWHPIWEGNPRLARPDEIGDFQTIQNGPNCRPYIAAKGPTKWRWRPFECAPGEIYFADAELEFARPYQPQIVMEPMLKRGASPNKAWGHDRWDRLSRMVSQAGYSVMQLGAFPVRPLPKSEFVQTPDFKRAAAVLAKAKLYVGPDGGLHHAAAALGVPAIVIRGAFISHECTGYAGQRNFFTGEGLGCGMRIRCPCCVKAMAKIAPEQVFAAVGEMLH